MTGRIQSPRNPRFKEWYRLVRRGQDPESPWIPLEGWKNVQQVAQRCPIELLLYQDPCDPRLAPLRATAREVIQVSPSLMSRLSSVRTSQGVLAFFRKPSWSWRDLTPCLLYLDGLQDPGNLGVLLRTAAATGCFSLLTAPDSVSCFNPKVIRASAGLLFSVPFLEGVPLQSLPLKEYTFWAASPGQGVPFCEASLKPPLVLVLGREGSGFQQVLPPGCRFLHIPMESGVESLNAAVAGSLLIYEVYRRGL